MIYVLYTFHVITCLFLILVVLLQQGQGADLAVFGGGGTQTAFGARGATQLIHKLTVYSFVAFIILTLAISVLRGTGGSASVMAGVSEEAPQEDQVLGAEEVVPEEQPAADESAAPATVPPESAPAPAEGGGSAGDTGGAKAPGDQG